MKRNHVCDHSGCEKRAREAAKYADRFVAGVERLMESHKPYPDAWRLRPGNSYASVGFYCDVCRTSWPCRVFNDLRALYAEVNEWPPAAEPYAPLVLHKATDAREETTDGAE